MVKKAWLGALTEMRQKGERHAVDSLQRLLVGLLSSDDPRVVVQTIKLAMEQEKHIKGTVTHEHKHSLSKTEVIERILARSANLDDSEFVRLAASLRADMGSNSGSADKSTQH